MGGCGTGSEKLRNSTYFLRWLERILQKCHCRNLDTHVLMVFGVGGASWRQLGLEEVMVLWEEESSVPHQRDAPHQAMTHIKGMFFLTSQLLEP